MAQHVKNLNLRKVAPVDYSAARVAVDTILDELVRIRSWGISLEEMKSLAVISQGAVKIRRFMDGE